ncbi:MAG: hypothetical protein AAFX93_18590 [Verrucomicrobiota bacterium]
MKLYQVVPSLVALLDANFATWWAANPDSDLRAYLEANSLLFNLFGPVPVFTSETEDDEYDAALKKAYANPGISIVITQAEGDPASARSNKPDVYLSNLVVITVIENLKKNITGKAAMRCVSDVLEVVRAANDQRDTFALGNPAYDRGPRDLGMVVFNINLLVKSKSQHA